MSAPVMGDGLDVEYVPDSGAGAPVYVEEPEPQPVVEHRTVELRGRRFRVREEGVSLLAMMKFATIAKQQQQAARLTQRDPAAEGAREMEGLAALYALLRSCIADDEWDAFEDHANTVGAGQTDLMGVVQQAASAGAARPTLPSSGSPGGRSTTAPSSAGASSSLGSSIQQGDVGVQQRLERQGRPDLALVVQRAREASTRSSTG